MATITSNGTGGGNWGTAATWVGAAVPADNDTVVIAAGDTVTFDADMSNAGTWPNGIAGITITSHATTPGMLRFALTGSNYLRIKTGTTIAGTNAAARGRLLANSDGVWGNTGVLPYTTKAIIDLGAAGKIDALYLDIALRGYEPTVKSATVYGTIQTVAGINTGTDVITLSAAHGWAAGTPVMMTSDGTYPGGLAADTVYYVRAASGADLKLALQNSDATIVNITSSGSGTIRIFDGHSNTGTATVNVLENLSAITGWSTTDGHNYAVLVDAAAPANYDQQRLQIATINAGSLVLSANVDSAQYPGARVWLVSRNMSIRSACTTALNIVDYGTGTHSGVLACEIRSTAGTGTTFYGTGINGSTGVTVSGAISGCTYGVNGGTGHTVSGTLSGCNYGVNGGTGHTVSGTVSGCSNGVNDSTEVTMSGAISGCTYGIFGGTGDTVSGTVSGCNIGIYSGMRHTVSGTLSGCNYGINGSTGVTVSGAISGCNYGVNGGTGVTMSGAIMSGNVNAINASSVIGYSVTLASTTQVAAYKHAQQALTESRNAVALHDFGGVGEYVGFWTLGGYCKTAAYAVGTHGTPPIANSYIHEMVFEDSDRVCWVEYAILGVSGQAVTATFYGKLTGTAAWTTRPTVGIYDPTKGWQAAAEGLNVSAQMPANTNWQTLTATYTPAHDRELRVRVQGIGGNADGTGTEMLYWFADIRGASAAGGGGPVIGSRIIRGLGAL